MKLERDAAVEVLNQIEGHARQMVQAEERHVNEIKKMLRRRGDA